jgi:hypothetical protein
VSDGVSEGLPNRSHNHDDRASERGVVLPISMVLMTALLLMSAMVIDIGQLSLARRQDQSAADVAAIAGVMNRSSDVLLVETVRTTLNSNLNAGFATADLDTCSGDVLPTGWTVYPGANCLSHDTSWTQLRVRVPTQVIIPAFAGLAGITEMEHSAIAQVYDRHASLVLPFAVTSDAGDYECIKVGAGNVPDPDCSDATSGNFGVVTFGLWGNPATGTTQDCTGTGTQFMVNVAQGVDHDLSRFGQLPHMNSEVIDTASCGAVPSPNAMITTTGNVPNKLAAGLFGDLTFPDGGPSRLRRVSAKSSFGTTSVAGGIVDDTPLWDFIDPNLSGADNVPRSCFDDQFLGDTGGLNLDNDLLMSSLPLAVKNHLILIPREDRMIRLVERCLTHYRGDDWDDGGALDPAETRIGCGLGACTDPVFAVDSENEVEDVVDIQASSRFGYVPQLLETTFPAGNSTVHIEAFRAVFLQRVYAGNCSTSGCPVTWDPGVGFSSTVATDKASALTAFIFPPGSLPNGLADDNALEKYGSNRFIEVTR